MVQNIHYHSKREERDSEESRQKPARKTPNPLIPCLLSNSLDGSVSLTLLFVTYISLGPVPLPVGRYSIVLACLTSWSLQLNPGSTHAFTQGHLRGSCPHKGSMQLSSCHLLLTSVVLLNHRGRFHKPFILLPFVTLKPELHGEHC